MIRGVLLLMVSLGLLGWAPNAWAERPGRRKKPAPKQAPKNDVPDQQASGEQVPYLEGSPGIDSELEDIAQLFIEKGQYAEALEVYDELRQAHVDDLDLLDMSIVLCRKFPECKVRLINFLNELIALVERNPKSMRARETLVDFALELKEFDKAHEAIKGLVAAKPDSITHWLLLADHHEETRDFRKLDALLADLLKRFPKSAEIWLRSADRAMAFNNNNQRIRFTLARTKQLLKPKDTLLRQRHSALEKEFNRWLRDAKEALYRDFRQDTRWADLEDDFAHSTYP